MLIKLLFILLISKPVFSQSYTTVSWNSFGHTQYTLQQSSDNKNWIKVDIINAQLTDTAFEYSLPTVNNIYFRVKTDGITSQPVKVINEKPIAIILNSQIKIQLP